MPRCLYLTVGSSRFVDLLMPAALSSSMLFLSACAKQHGEELPTRDKPLLSIKFDEFLADTYFIEDPACQAGEGASDIGQTDIQRWGSGGTKAMPFAFEQTASKDSLASQSVTDTRYGLYQKTQCVSKSGETTCADEADVVTSSAPLKVCRSNPGFDRVSIEGVALSSLASLTEAANFFKSIPNKPADLPNFSLLVLPIVEKDIQLNDTHGQSLGTQRQIVTDNLAYTPNYNDQPAFIVFPKGRNSVNKGIWKGLNLWELPWGLAHEFGHHVFRTFSKIGIASRSDSGDDRLNMDDMLPIVGGFKDKTKKARVDAADDAFNLASGSSYAAGATTEDQISAVNEGFADLYAHYVAGGNSEQLNGVDCFDKNRDVANSEFATGEKKVLSNDIMEEFMSQIDRRDNDGCATPSFTDVHTIGAVVAHGVDRLFATAPKNSNPDKALLLINWASKISKLGRSGATVDNLLRTALLTIAEASGQGDRTLSKEQCQIARDVFPRYAENWLSGTTGFACK